jgi:hypothetical protein
MASNLHLHGALFRHLFNIGNNIGEHVEEHFGNPFGMYLGIPWELLGVGHLFGNIKIQKIQIHLKINF